MSDVHRTIAARVAAHLEPGEVVDLGIGIPTFVADMLEPERGLVLKTENGLLGVGPAPPADQGQRERAAALTSPLS